MAASARARGVGRLFTGRCTRCTLTTERMNAGSRSCSEFSPAELSQEDRWERRLFICDRGRSTARVRIRVRIRSTAWVWRIGVGVV